jgi:hypothetical protein
MYASGKLSVLAFCAVVLAGAVANTAVPAADGQLTPIERAAAAQAIQGTSEARYALNVASNASMTDATAYGSVEHSVGGPFGVSYQGNGIRIESPLKAPVTLAIPADLGD